MAGSLGLNHRFVEAVKRVVDEDQFSKLCKSEVFDDTLLDFDRKTKREFRGVRGERYRMHFPGANLKNDLLNNLISDSWTMYMFVVFFLVSQHIGNILTVNREDVKAIFDPLIADIERLVEDQVQGVLLKRNHENHPKAREIKVCDPISEVRPYPNTLEVDLKQAIFRVGGFGSTHYLKSRLQQSQPQIQIIQPKDPWSAIVK
jgi:hypothetical protein